MKHLTFKGTDRTTDEHGQYITEQYEYGQYIIYRTVYFWTTGRTDTSFSVNPVSRDNYIPEIFFEGRSCIHKDRQPEFKIQTTAYGSKRPEEIEKVIAGYQQAIELVKILTEAFL